MVDIFVAWPMPLIWLILIGLCFVGSVAGRRLLVGCCVLLVGSALPIVAATLAAPLSWGAAQSDDQLAVEQARAVLVPTAGSFRDASGRWWPEEGSIRRLAAGLEIAAKLNLPVVVAGGSPLSGQPSEAKTVRQLLGAERADIVVVPKGRNSWETAAELANSRMAQLRSVILVTDTVHVARMRAVPRRQGISVVASIAAGRVGRRLGPQAPPWWSALLPSRKGLNSTRAALHEYVGIAWYIATSRIRVSDL